MSNDWRWLFLGLGLSMAVAGPIDGYATYGVLARAGSLPGAAGAAPVAARGEGDGARMSSPCPSPGAASAAVAKTAPARRISRANLAMVLGLGSIVAWPAMGNRRVAWTVKGWRAGSARAKLAGPIKI